MLRQMIKIILFLLILLLINLLNPAYHGVFVIIKDNLLNVFIAEGIAYISYPIVLFLKNKLKFPSSLANFVTIILFFGIFFILGTLVVPLLYDQIMKLIRVLSNPNSLSWINENPHTKEIFSYVEPYIDQITKNLLNWFAQFSTGLIGTSTKLVTNAVIVICLYIYILVDAPRIINLVKRKLKKGTKRYQFVAELDRQLKQYIKAIIIITAIMVVEYALVYGLIGHPDYKTLAAMVVFANLIPYFGGILVNIIALITAAFVSQELFIRVCICVLILPNIEGNIINPMVHKKTSNVSPIIVLPALFIGSGIFGVIGIVITLPVLICLKIFYKYYGKDIKNFLRYAWSS